MKCGLFRRKDHEWRNFGGCRRKIHPNPGTGSRHPKCGGRAFTRSSSEEVSAEEVKLLKLLPGIVFLIYKVIHIYFKNQCKPFELQLSGINYIHDVVQPSPLSISKTSLPLKETVCPLSSNSSSPLPQALASFNLLFVPMNSPILGTSLTWTHIIFVF